MKVTIIKSENKVVIDGETRPVDLSALNAGIHVIQFDGVRGEIEWKQGMQGDNARFITNLDPYQSYLDEWTAWTPPAPPDPTPPTRAEIIAAARRAAADIILEEQLLAREADVDTPQEVTDYLTEKRRPARV